MQAPYKRNATRWNKPDREWLEYQHYVLGKTLGYIGKETGASVDTVQYWKKVLEIDWKHLVVPGEIHPPFKVGMGDKQGSARFYGVTKAWLEREYTKLEKSANRIAGENETTTLAVMSWLRRHEVSLRTVEELGQRHSRRMSGSGNPAWVGGTAQRYQTRLLADSDQPKQCVWCGTTEKLQTHHIDHDRDNGDLSNLVWLCGPCNRLESHAWTLQKLGRATFHYEDKRLVVQFQ